MMKTEFNAKYALRTVTAEPIRVEHVFKVKDAAVVSRE
jgi:hypothetical protein